MAQLEIPALSAWQRLAWLLSSWLLYFWANPGVLTPEGVPALAFVALVPYAHAAVQPGRAAFWIEWLAAGIGFSAICWWGTYVWVGTLIAVALVPALYTACTGLLLRRLVPRWPLALAFPAVWVALEIARSHAEPPFGFGWMRLGHCLHSVEPFLGSTRVFGVAGLSFAVAALAGGLCDWWHRRRRLRVQLAALLPLFVIHVAGRSTEAPAQVAGPRVLAVQPAFEQRRKMQTATREELFEEMLQLTRQGIEGVGSNQIDLVAWGETLYPYPLADSGLAQAYGRGVVPAPWSQVPTLDQVHIMQRLEQQLIRGELFGKRRIIPVQASFLTGSELYIERDGWVRRSNAGVLYDRHGQRVGAGLKLHTVPGGEQMAGLERFEWVRSTAFAVAGYIPDLVAGEETAVLPLEYGAGRRAQFGLSVCFDNAYDDAYTAPLRRGALDFHVVLSNEAWFETSFEYDQMMAFTRVAAAQTGRSFVRVTNSGITALVGADGRELERLDVDGRDRMVRGHLLLEVPVPAAGEAAPKTWFVRYEIPLLWALGLLPLALLGLGRRRLGYSRTEPG